MVAAQAVVAVNAALIVETNMAEILFAEKEPLFPHIVTQGALPAATLIMPFRSHDEPEVRQSMHRVKMVDNATHCGIVVDTDVGKVHQFLSKRNCRDAGRLHQLGNLQPLFRGANVV